jgi:hypothetical protein
MVSFMPRPFYPQGKSPWYPLDRRLGGPQSCSGHGGEEKNSTYINYKLFFRIPFVLYLKISWHYTSWTLYPYYVECSPLPEVYLIYKMFQKLVLLPSSGERFDITSILMCQ